MQEIMNIIQIDQKPTKIASSNGSVLAPIYGGLKYVLVPHNTEYEDKSPLFVAITNKLKRVKDEYIQWRFDNQGFGMSKIKECIWMPDVHFIYMILKDEKGQYLESNVEKALQTLAQKALYENASVHIDKYILTEYPCFESLVEKELVNKGVIVVYYETIVNGTAVDSTTVKEDRVVRQLNGDPNETKQPVSKIVRRLF